MVSLKSIIALVLGSLLLVIGLVYLTNQQQTTNDALVTTNSSSTATATMTAPVAPEVLAAQQPIPKSKPMNPVAIMKTNKGTIEIELYADVMPITTSNFIKLAKEGFYNGIKFHRVIPQFMIQAGDPNTKGTDTSIYGTGGPGYTIQDEFVSDPRLTNTRGAIAMANTGQPNSGGSQFFIDTVDNTGLDFDKPPFTSKHPVFGRVIAGMDVVDAISATPTAARDIPVNPVVIESVTIQNGTKS